MEIIYDIIPVEYGKQMVIDGQSDLWYSRVGLFERLKEVLGETVEDTNKVINDGLDKMYGATPSQREELLFQYLRGRSFEISPSAIGPNKAYLTDESLVEIIQLIAFQTQKDTITRVLAKIPGDNYAPTGSQVWVEATNEERGRLRELLNKELENLK